MATKYVPGQAHKVYMATVARTEEAAVTILTERAAEFYGVHPDWIGLVITNAEQADTTETATLCDTEPVVTDVRFSVEGYAYYREP